MITSRSLALLALALLAACTTPRDRPRSTRVPKAGTRASTALTAMPPFSDQRAMRVHLIDIGQGAATLIEFPCAAVLVDTGGEEHESFHSNEVLIAYLDAFFTARPDLDRTLAAVYLTHQHIDHTRGGQAVFERYKVANVITNGMTDSSGGPEQDWLQQAAITGDAGYMAVLAADIPAGGLSNKVIDPVACADVDPRIEVLWGAVDRANVTWMPDVFESRNNHSVVVRFDVGDSSLLITGDLEVPGIVAMIKKHKETDALDVDVYQVGHHGSHNGTTARLMKAMSPEMALIACGDPRRELDWTAWKYGHPRKITIERLVEGVSGHRRRKQVQVATYPRTFEGYSLTDAIYATGWDGTVVAELRADGSSQVWTATGD